MKKFNIISLGCPKNLVDSEVISYKMTNSGYTLVQKEKIDVVIVNTCAFLKSAVKESEKVIDEQIKLKRQGKVKKIAVCGCLVEKEKDRILKKYPEIDAIVGINSLDKITESINQRKSHILPVPKILNSYSRLRLTLSHSGYLKISDGCNNNCSYCLIPFIRGRLRSKPIEAIIEEAKALVNIGAKEIILIAQDITSYGRDIYGEYSLKSLLRKMIKIKSLKWLRLMYLYPDRIDEELLKIIKNSPNICHYLEIPLQHISNNILKKMNRTSNEKLIKEKIELIRKIIPDIAIRTTFIVGFPGETEEDFKKLLNFVKEYKFNNLAVFKYSREKGSPAYSFMPQISYSVKQERYKEILKMQSKIIDRINSDLMGKEFEILVDSSCSGRTYMDAPDIDGYVRFADKKVPGTFFRGKIVEARGYIRNVVNIS